MYSNIRRNNSQLSREKDKFISKLKHDSMSVRKDGSLLTLHNTFDFETVVVNNKHYVFCASVCCSIKKDKRNIEIRPMYIDAQRFNIQTIEDVQMNVLKQFWEFLTVYGRRNLRVKSSNGRKIVLFYAHNFSRFDGMYILKLIDYLISSNIIVHTQINLVVRNDVIYEISISVDKEYCIVFRDSIHILPGKLNDLAYTFCGERKYEIDVNFTEDYIINNMESIVKYCNKDSELLYKVLTNYYLKIYNEFKVDIFHCITMSSLAYKIMRVHYLEEGTVENTSNNRNLNTFIRLGYRGGISTVVNPINLNNEINVIDVNSSYPYAMTLDLPTGLGRVLGENEINNIGDDLPFGYVDVNLSIKSDMTISPIIANYKGKLTDVNGEIRIVMFSEELKFALKYGVKIIKINEYVVYKRGKILNRFANELYDSRVKTDDKALKLIYKLLLNSAYGRFALREIQEFTAIVDMETYKRIEDYISVSSSYEFKNGKMITFTKINDVEDDSNLNEFDIKLIDKTMNDTSRAVQIAGAITSYARIKLLSTAYKIIELGGIIYYMDTDSIHYSLNSDVKLDFIGDKLGQWKKENSSVSGIYLQSKMYAIKDKTGKVTFKMKGLPKEVLPSRYTENEIWDIYNEMYNGSRKLELTFDKNFTRSIGDKSVIIYEDRRFSTVSSYDKREKINDENGKWIGTKSIEVSYDFEECTFKSNNSGVNDIKSNRNIPGYDSVKMIDVCNEVIDKSNVDKMKRSVKLMFNCEEDVNIYINYLDKFKFKVDKFEIKVYINDLNDLKYMYKSYINHVINMIDCDQYDNNEVKRLVKEILIEVNNIREKGTLLDLSKFTRRIIKPIFK